MMAVPPYYGMPIPSMFVATEDGQTFNIENDLPSLPVPQLAHTLAVYLDSVRPHLTPDEFQVTQDIVRRFATGVGNELQSKLMETSNHSRNWLEDWWEHYGYLTIRIPNPFVNFGNPLPFPLENWPARLGTQCERAALVIWYMMQFRQLLRKEQLRVDKGGRTTTWSMYQYYRLFNGCRTPGETVDTLNDYFKTEREGACPQHIVVICSSRYFTFNIIDSDGNVITAPEIEAQLKAVRRYCEGKADGSAVGALTAENRTVWYQLREHLISLHPDNMKCLMDIQTSISVVVLDDRTPESVEDVCREALTGDSKNRWFDKTCSTIVFQNGLFATNCDHAPMDGIINVNHCYFFCLGLEQCGYKWMGTQFVRNLPSPVELLFHVDDRILKAIDTAYDLHQTGGESMELICRKFTSYGKSFIRDSKFHPDTFVQMALQYGYYRLHNRPGAAYETASTRKFYHGRTETVRSCSSEVIAWSKAMLDNQISSSDRLRLLLIAVDKHNKSMAEAQENHGCDRHLFGLQITAREHGLSVPELFTDPAYTKSGGGGNYILSTSCVGYTPLIGGVSPMCKNGYGFFYSIEPDHINTYVIRWKEDDTDVHRLYHSVTQSLLDMKQLILDRSNAKL